MTSIKFGDYMTSIFDIENRLNYQKEFQKMLQYLHYEKNAVGTRDGRSFSFIEAINYEAFGEWPYRGTALDCQEFLENIGLDDYTLSTGSITNKKFLYYLEFIYNILLFALENEYIEIENNHTKSVLHNIDKIIELMNYEFIFSADKWLLVKRSADIDSVLKVVNSDISSMLLEYNDFRNENDICRKREILKTLDKYLEENQEKLKQIDNSAYKSVGHIMNNFGINHKLPKKYKEISNEELIKLYDDCFLLVLHLIRYPEIKRINNEIKMLEE